MIFNRYDGASPIVLGPHTLRECCVCHCHWQPCPEMPAHDIAWPVYGGEANPAQEGKYLLTVFCDRCARGLAVCLGDQRLRDLDRLARAVAAFKWWYDRDDDDKGDLEEAVRDVFGCLSLVGGIRPGDWS